MKQSNPIFKSFVADQNAMTENGRQYLFDKYGDDKAFQLSSIAIEDILYLETSGISISPQEYEDLGG
jgi:hypothetical protein|tara:strand:+ start:302 stop:502 length:201 start_codon:yes stop_codon:yes gene_type:complete